MKKKKSEIVSKSNIKMNNDKDDSWRTPTKSDIENSPMNRSHRKSLIYI